MYPTYSTYPTDDELRFYNEWPNTVPQPPSQDEIFASEPLYVPLPLTPIFGEPLSEDDSGQLLQEEWDSKYVLSPQSETVDPEDLKGLFVDLEEISPEQNRLGYLARLDVEDKVLLSNEEILALREIFETYALLRPDEKYLDLFYQKLSQLFLHHKQENVKFSPEVISIMREVFAIKDDYLLRNFNFFLNTWEFDDLATKQKQLPSDENLNLILAKASEITITDILTFQPEWVIYFSKNFADIVSQILKISEPDFQNARNLLDKAYELMLVGKERIKHHQPLFPGFKTIAVSYRDKLKELRQKIESLDSTSDYHEPSQDGKRRRRNEFCNPGRTSQSFCGTSNTNQQPNKKPKPCDRSDGNIRSNAKDEQLSAMPIASTTWKCES